MWPFRKKTKDRAPGASLGVAEMPRSNKHCRARAAEAFVKYMAEVYGLEVGEPRSGTPEGCWYAFNRKWTFTEAALMIDARKFWTATHVRLFTGTPPEGAEIVVEFYG